MLSQLRLEVRAVWLWLWLLLHRLFAGRARQIANGYADGPAPSAGSQRDLICTEQYHTAQLHISGHDQIDGVDNSMEGFSQMLVSSEETPPSTNEVVSYFIHTSFILSIAILITGEWKVNRELA